MGLRNLPGGVPEPHELIGREHLIDLLWKQLAGTNIFLVAPRRFGKTGVMRHVYKKPRNGHLPVYLEVEDVHSPQEFAAEMLASLAEQARLRKILAQLKRVPAQVSDLLAERIDEVGVDQFKIKLRDALGEKWKTLSGRLIREMEKADGKVIFIIDEFPQMIENVSKAQGQSTARSLLAWFRSLRMRQKDELRRFRFILAGSTGIDVVLRKLQSADKLNDFFRLPVEPLSEHDGRELLRRLADSYQLQFKPEAVDRLLHLIGAPVPYFIHLFVSQILLEPDLKDSLLTPENVEAVFSKRLTGPSCRAYLEYFRQRLKRYEPALERAASAILQHIADSRHGRVAESTLFEIYSKTRKNEADELEFREILADLECDLYVSLDTATNEYFFQMEIMKAWWKRFYAKLKPTPKK